MKKVLVKFKNQGINEVVFGDIFLEDVKKYRDELLDKLDMKGIYPIWKVDSKELARKFIELGFKAVTTCIDSQQIDKKFAGREYDSEFLNDLPNSADPCGENGEFHTFVYKEKTLDEFTKKGASSIPQTPATSVQSPKVKKRIEEDSKKSAKNNPRKSGKDTIKTASLPKYKKPDIKIPENKKDTPADDKKIDKISKKELLQAVQNPFLYPNQNSLSLKGTRNVPKEDTVDQQSTNTFPIS